MSWISITTTIIVVIAICWVVGLKNSVFLLPDENESLVEKGKKTGVAAILFSAYHYGIMMPAALGIVAALKFWNCPYFAIFFIMWILNALNGWLIVLKINDKTKRDMTLMEGTRRMVDAVIEKNKVAGILLEAYWLFRLIFGTVLATDNFSRPRINKHKALVAIIFLIAAGMQMLLWTAVYYKGYDSLSQLF